MKKVLSLMLSIFFLLLSCTSSTELIENGKVTKETEKWGLFVNSPGKGMMIAKNEEIIYFVDMIGSDKWHLQGYYAGLTFIEDASYTLSFDMASSIPRDAQIRIQLDSSPYTGYLEKDIKLTEKMTNYKFDFVMEEESDNFAKLCFNIGKFDGMTREPHEIRVDNLSIKVNNKTLKVPEKKEAEPIIAINQLGYKPLSIKEVRINTEAKGFILKSADTGSILYTDVFTGPIDDPASGEMVYVGDFTNFTNTGSFIIEVPDIGESYTFEIQESIYDDLYKAVEKMFYYQKCGADLTKDKAGIWAHNACHTAEATIFGTTTKLDVTGGWHDAGDYGRYTSPGVKAVADLFIASEYNKDILNVTRYELDWLLKMQDIVSGGVYHKVTTKNFIGSVMPDKNLDELFISPISATATGAFAAIMAKTSRLYKETDPLFSENTLKASLKAWNWLEQNQNVPGFTNPKGISTGEYGDSIDGDERFWASIELFLTTGTMKFQDYAIKSYTEKNWKGLSWANVGSYGVISYIFDSSENKDANFNKLLTKSFLDRVKELSDSSLKDGYGISLGVNYEWGSNELVADNAMSLLLANKLNKNELYLDQAMTHIHYLLGANSLGQSYISGFGDNTIEHPHHRPTDATGEVVPGMLAGGPNKSLQDPLAKNKLIGMAPGKCFLDAQPSYSTNEITIYWNSPLYAALSALQ